MSDTVQPSVNERLLTRGHRVLLATITRWIAHDDPPHAILLSGPPNVGKTTLALDLAAGLLCLAPDPADRPCRACLACRKVERGVHPDVHRLLPQGPGGQIRIAAVRELGSALALLPLEGRRRIAIVESADRLNEDAQNALLKTLEEPPAGTVIVLCADDDDPILPTVRSRSVRLALPSLPPTVVAAFLGDRGMTDTARAARIARLAAGRPGVAVAIAAQPELELTLGRVARHLLDLTRADRRRRLAAAGPLIAEGALLVGLGGPDVEGTEQAPSGRPGELGSPELSPGPPADTTMPGPAASTAVAPARRRRAVAALLGTWRSVARDLAVVARGARGSVRWIDLVDELEAVAAGLEAGAPERFLARIERTSALVDANANPELALDALLLSWPWSVGPERTGGQAPRTRGRASGARAAS